MRIYNAEEVSGFVAGHSEIENTFSWYQAQIMISIMGFSSLKNTSYLLNVKLLTVHFSNSYFMARDEA